MGGFRSRNYRRFSGIGYLTAGLVIGAVSIGVLRAQSSDGNTPSSLPGNISYLYGWNSTSWDRVTSFGGALKTVIASNPGNTAASIGAVSATIISGGTFQAVTSLGFNTGRKGCKLVNKSTDPMYVSVAPTPSIALSVILNPGTATTDGGSFDCATMSAVPGNNAISVMAATTGDTYLAMGL